MAVTLRAPSLRPTSSKTLPYPRRNPHFPATHVGFLLRHTFTLNPSPLLLPKTHSFPSPAHRSDQVGGDGNQSREIMGSPEASIWMKNLLGFALNNFLPLALVGGVMFGLVNPSLGCLADRYYLSKFSTFGIFIISGLTLRSDEIGAAAEAWPVGIFGLGSILLFTPFFSKLILQLQLQPQEFVTGLAIFSCMPTTLSSGVALTRLAGGNSALALAMTLVSSLLGILVVPFSISMFIANGVGVSVPTEQLFRSLILTLLVPLLVGKVFRETFKGLAVFIDQNRKLLSMISALLLGLVPWIQVSRSRALLLMVKPAVFLVAVGMGALLHLILLAFNALSIQGLSAVSGGKKSVFAKRENASALLIVASQKTLPVMVAVVEQLGGALGESGLLVLPCVAAHLNQIIIDSFLVNFLLREEPSVNKAKVA
ncbi:probable sodium/metabolite cotransporter BASS4, chloroplastic isoform X1 [Rhododendron vialii]|uniref:probable sodium/metabolite cotransporter BASS4, chloroplastic isoform X1 n=2 Tax=Rhododendron vialii TaxID=182163 RepID=UPI00265F305D|nr:probable sodium/metabolite cotransporter BASS4, chloroplastic isoform X1 [Rhododendron vialii]